MPRASSCAADGSHPPYQDDNVGADVTGPEEVGSTDIHSTGAAYCWTQLRQLRDY